jgi:predicted small lipoprotein YifL
MIPHAARLAALLLALGLTACGQKGPLYLPDTTQGEIVTRPAPATTTGTSNSPASPDTPSQSASPAPEVTAPEPAAEDPAEKDKKNGTQPPK